MRILVLHRFSGYGTSKSYNLFINDFFKRNKNFIHTSKSFFNGHLRWLLGFRLEMWCTHFNWSIPYYLWPGKCRGLVLLNWRLKCNVHRILLSLLVHWNPKRKSMTLCLWTWKFGVLVVVHCLPSQWSRFVLLASL